MHYNPMLTASERLVLDFLKTPRSTKDVGACAPCHIGDKRRWAHRTLKFLVKWGLVSKADRGGRGFCREVDFKTTEAGLAALEEEQ